MDEQKPLKHTLNLIERESLTITGVVKILSSSLNQIVLKLSSTDLTIIGTNLSLENFNDNEVLIKGMIDQIKYSKSNKTKQSFFKRIFG